MSNDKEEVKKEADQKIEEAKKKAENTDWLSGKKTYIVAGVVILFTGLQVFGIDVPPEVWTVAGALGLGALRKAFTKSESSADAAREAVEAVNDKIKTF